MKHRLHWHHHTIPAMVILMTIVTTLLIFYPVNSQLPNLPSLFDFPEITAPSGSGLPNLGGLFPTNNNSGNSANGGTNTSSPPASSSSSSPTTGASSNSNASPNPLSFLNNLIPSGNGLPPLPGTSASKSEDIPSILGPWVPDGNCVPTGTCCCATGPQIITVDDSGATKVSGALSASGCQGFTDTSEVFKKFPFIPVSNVNATVSTWSIPLLGFNYRGQLLPDYDTITVRRTDSGAPQGCLNTLFRASFSDSDSPSGGSTTPPTGGTTNPSTGTGTGSSGSNLIPQDLNSNGSFSSTGANTIITAPSTIPIDSSHSITVDIMQESASSAKYMVRLTLVPASSLFSTSVGASWVTLHYISPTASDDRAALANPLNVAMSQSDVGGLVWSYSGIGLQKDSGAGNGMRISFSYLQPSTNTPKQTPTYFFSPWANVVPSGSGGSGAGSGSGSSGGSSGGGSTPSTVPGKWAGTYTIDTSQCKSSSSCCCALGKIVVAEIPGNTGKVAISSTLDGSSTCGGMTDVDGDFTLDTNFSVSYAYPDSPLTLKAELSPSYDTLSFSNSIYDCKSIGRRTKPAWADNAGNTPSTPSPTSPSPTSGDSGTSGGNTGTQSGLLSVIGGEWKATDKCKPTTNCCCLEGGLNIIAPSAAIAQGKTLPSGSNANDPSTVFVVGNLDGGIACFRHKEIDGVCNINQSLGTGSCKLQGINFNATISEENTHLTIENSMYLNCVSTAIKSSEGFYTSVMGVMGWMAVFMIVSVMGFGT